jgi:tetratricopeptide (TPR) repeat protein
MKKPLLVFVTIILVFIAFSPSLKNGFVNWDDQAQVTENPLLREFSLGGIKTIFTTFHLLNYHPLALLSYMCELKAFGFNPFIYHLTSLLLHLLNTLLVYWLIYKLTNNFPVACLTSLFFGIHPLQVEAIAWISSRREPLYSLFFLGSLIGYISYRKTARQRYYILSLILFLLALLSKATSVVLPLVLILCDYFMGVKIDKKVFAKKWPYYILALLFIGITAYIRIAGTDFNRNESLRIFHNIIIASHSIIFYLSKIVAPIRLSVLYPYPYDDWTKLPLHFLILPFVVLGLGILTAYSARYNRKIIFGSGFYLITLLPVLQLIRSRSAMLAADHYAYLPLIGIFYLVSEGCVWLFLRKDSAGRIIRLITFFIIIAVVSALVLLTQQRCSKWKDSLTLWNDTLAIYPNMSIAHSQRGLLSFEKRDFEKAKADFEEALVHGHSYFDKNFRIYYHIDVGRVFLAQGKVEEAKKIFETIKENYPIKSDVYFNLAECQWRLGKPKEAFALYEKTLQINPYHLKTYISLSILLNAQGKTEEATQLLQNVLGLDPYYLDAYKTLISIYKKAGRNKDIFLLYKKMVDNNVGYFLAYYTIGNAYCQVNKEKLAIPLFKKAILLRPESANAYFSLGKAYSLIGKHKEAIRNFTYAIKIRPEFPQAYHNLAISYYALKRYDMAISYCDKAIGLGDKVEPSFLELLKAHRK